MKFFYILISLLVLLPFNSCKKDGEKCDWQIVDNSGQDLAIIRNKTEAELLACTDCGISNGQPAGTPLGQIISSCNYFNLCDQKFCWMVNGQFMEKLSEKYVNCFFPSSTKTKVDCSYCALWYTRQKNIYVPANSTIYSTVTHKFYCADTATKFNSGIEFIIKNTSDSLISLQYSKDGINWH